MILDMTIEQIKSLLSFFYEGQTTPNEERLLADFFHREDVPEELQEDKQLFLMLAQISDQEMPQDVAEEITAFVNNLGQTEKRPVLSEEKQRKGIIYRLKTPPKMWYRVAATVAILLAIGGGMFFRQRAYTTDPFRDTCSTPEEAADAILYANDIINRSAAPFLRSTMIATEQVNDINQTLGKIQPYINQ
ncbi:MAG: hypothetical protein II970_04290 [Paludibacteraceae bacterium]|nr:hypothetical protein [Paludibacteraceae bacterium]